MAYETGIASTVTDILDKLRLFAAGNGWVINRWVSAGNGYELCLSKENCYFNLRAYSNELFKFRGQDVSSVRWGIAINGSDSYSESSAWDQQPGRPVHPTSNYTISSYLPLVLGTGPFPSYHLFETDNCIYLELEVRTDTFQRLGFGRLTPFNAATIGSPFFYATSGSAEVTNATNNYSWLGADVDDTNYSQEEVPFRGADINTSSSRCASFVRTKTASLDAWASSGGRISTIGLTRILCQGGGVLDKILYTFGPNPVDAVSVMCPNIVGVSDDDTYLIPVGYLPNLQFTLMTNYSAKEEFLLGQDRWKLFPWFAKGGRTGQRAIAYRIIE